MKVLLYAAETDEKAKRLKSVVVEVAGEENLEVFHHIHDLVWYFCKPRPADDLTIGVFAVTDRENLRQLISIRDLIANLRNILVLPDRNNKTIAEGHKLQPRFITYRDNDFMEIGVVLGKMIESAVRASPNLN